MGLAGISVSPRVIGVLPHGTMTPAIRMILLFLHGCPSSHECNAGSDGECAGVAAETGVTAAPGDTGPRDTAVADTGSAETADLGGEDSGDPDTGGDDTADVPAESPCASWTGFREGATWTYDFDGSLREAEVVSITLGDGVAVVRRNIAATGAAYDETVDTAWRCDADGLWYLGSTLYGWYATGDEPNCNWECWYDGLSYEPVLVLPTSAEPGATWSAEWYVTRWGTHASGDYFTYWASFSLSEEEITVPAGTFTTRRLDWTLDSEWYSDEAGTIWFADDVGPVGFAGMFTGLGGVGELAE